MSDNNSICASLIERLNKFELDQELTDKVVDTMDGLLSTDTGSSTEVVMDPNVDSEDGVHNHEEGIIDNNIVS
jgi:hypothetical protein